MLEQLYFIKEKAVSTHIYFGCSSNLSATINQFISNCINDNYILYVITNVRFANNIF